MLKLPSLNVTTALPVLFLAVMVNTARPFSSVVLFLGETVTRLLLETLAFMLSPSTGQPFLPVTVIVTLLLPFVLSLSSEGDADMFSASTHSSVGVDVGVAVGVGVGVVYGTVIEAVITSP